MCIVVEGQLRGHNIIQIEIMDKAARGVKVSVVVRSLKHVMVHVNTAHAQVMVFTSTKLGSNAMGESSVVLIKHSVENLPAEASVS
jgi:hypothetical protein